MVRTERTTSRSQGGRSTTELHPVPSAQQDLNLRPLVPQTSALTKLRHEPIRKPVCCYAKGTCRQPPGSEDSVPAGMRITPRRTSALQIQPRGHGAHSLEDGCF